MKKILIIGKNGLIGKNLFNYFKSKKMNIYRIGFKSFLKNKNINSFDIIINCTSNHKFVKNKYANKNDNDLGSKAIFYIWLKEIDSAIAVLCEQVGADIRFWSKSDEFT